MHITLPRNQLLATVNPLHGLTAGKSTVPILQNLLLEASADFCRVTATDLDITARRQLPAQVHTEGAVTLPTAPLRAIVNELDNTDIDITVDSALRATISCKQSTITLQGLPKDDFPSIREPHSDGITLDRSIFLDLIRHTLFAASSDSTRLVLNSVLLRIDSHQMQMVATDGRRLAIAQAGPGAADSAPIDAIIPRKAASTILKLWPQKGETITAEVTDGHLLLHGDDTLLDARLVDGSFPNYEQIIPVNPPRQATVDREALLAALRRTSTILDEPTRPVAFTLTLGRLDLHSSNLDLGEARERLDAAYQQEEMTVGFNTHYLLEFFSTLSSAQITIQLEDPTSPALFSATDEDRYRYVIAPIRLT